MHGLVLGGLKSKICPSIQILSKTTDSPKYGVAIPATLGVALTFYLSMLYVLIPFFNWCVKNQDWTLDTGVRSKYSDCQPLAVDYC